ncbi:MAG: hypothetical protein FJX72_08600 [Armatimonadetes bacterium]|nr:hypothetical protein [Armatimonadota bacterium]
MMLNHGPVSAQSDLVIGISPDTILIAPNGSAPVSGWITNHGTSTVDLLGLMVNLSHSGITWDEDAFVASFPETLGAGETVFGTSITAYAAAGATPGDYLGSLYVYSDPEDSNEVPFTLRLEGAIVPELGAITALAGTLGLGGFGLLRRRLGRRTT